MADSQGAGTILNLFKKNKHICNNEILAPVKGKAVALETVNDPVFSEKIMGDGIAIVPDNSVIVSPVDGQVIMLFPTKHAIGLKAEYGEEIMIHIGIETVNLNGTGFETFVRQGDYVKAGQKLISFDREKIKAENIDDTVMLILTEQGKYDFTVENREVKEGDLLLKIYEKSI